jgi:hypothetical protein
MDLTFLVAVVAVDTIVAVVTVIISVTVITVIIVMTIIVDDIEIVVIINTFGLRSLPLTLLPKFPSVAVQT